LGGEGGEGVGRAGRGVTSGAGSAKGAVLTGAGRARGVVTGTTGTRSPLQKHRETILTHLKYCEHVKFKMSIFLTPKNGNNNELLYLENCLPLYNSHTLSKMSHNSIRTDITMAIIHSIDNS
jgi:hypothetical protein